MSASDEWKQRASWSVAEPNYLPYLRHTDSLATPATRIEDDNAARELEVFLGSHLELVPLLGEWCDVGG